MKIWRIVIKDGDSSRQQAYRGEAKDYKQAAECALGLATEDAFEEPWVDEISCWGEKDF